MKHTFSFSLLTFILTVLVTSCDNESETVHTYSRPYYLSKDYPIYLDAGKILTDIQVKPSVNPEAAFKIVSTDEYIFVGEMMKGVHVYKRTDLQHLSPLCFIECKYLKAFDVMNDHLYCNNFVDLLVVDVKNPLQAKVIHREKEYFNRYRNSDWNINYITAYDTKLYEIGYKNVTLSGIETETDPAPDFYEYDELYREIVTDEIPDSLRTGKPYVGFAGMSDMVCTFGYSALAFCAYDSRGLIMVQSAVLDYPYYTNYPPFNIHYEDKMLYATGENFINFYDINTQKQEIYYANSIKDASYMESQKAFWFFSGYGISGGRTTDGQYFTEYVNIPGVETMTCVDDHIITLGSRLEVYSAPSLEVVKKYTDISGSCILKEGHLIITAGKQGVFIYDISDLKDIKLIP